MKTDLDELLRFTIGHIKSACVALERAFHDVPIYKLMDPDEFERREKIYYRFEILERAVVPKTVLPI